MPSRWPLTICRAPYAFIAYWDLKSFMVVTIQYPSYVWLLVQLLHVLRSRLRLADLHYVPRGHAEWEYTSFGEF